MGKGRKGEGVKVRKRNTRENGKAKKTGNTTEKERWLWEEGSDNGKGIVYGTKGGSEERKQESGK